MAQIPRLSARFTNLLEIDGFRGVCGKQALFAAAEGRTFTEKYLFRNLPTQGISCRGTHEELGEF
jgi:hypothetical protein